MPQLRQERSGSDGACPDASTVLAVIEGEADEWLRNAYAHHLAQCSACLELDSLLRNFDRPALADEAEWRRTETRLDNWLNAFVESRATAAPQPVEKRAARAGFWESIWRPGLAWKLSLAMGLGALVAVGTSVYTKWRLPFWPDQGKVATSAAPAEESSSIPLPAENPHPKSEVPKNTERETPGPTAPLLPGGVMNRGGPMAAAPKAPPQVEAQPKPEESATAAGKARPSEPQQQAALKPPPTPPVHGPEPLATAPGRTTAATTTGKPRPSRTESASAPAMANVAAGRVPARTTYAQAPQAAATVPASLHLAAGARLWLALESFSFQADGRVVFHGSLLLPLNSTGSSALDHGTVVSGFVTSAQGQSSVLLSEIVIRGAHYKLKSQAGAGNARAAGSGGAVQFDSGKVLEMWVSSDSIYERSTADSTQ